jgi:hypothetical protein
VARLTGGICASSAASRAQLLSTADTKEVWSRVVGSESPQPVTVTSSTETSIGRSLRIPVTGIAYEALSSNGRP